MDLPESAIHYNDQWLETREPAEGAQPEEEINRILRDAKVAPGARLAPMQVFWVQIFSGRKGKRKVLKRGREMWGAVCSS